MVVDELTKKNIEIEKLRHEIAEFKKIYNGELKYNRDTQREIQIFRMSDTYTNLLQCEKIEEDEAYDWRKGVRYEVDDVRYAYRQGMRDADEVPNWISVNERQPEGEELFERMVVLVNNERGNYDHQWYKGYYSGDCWYIQDECGDNIRTPDVTHWMKVKVYE